MAKLPAQDIVERLLSPLAISKEHRDQAADTISRLTADNEAERAAMDVTQRRAIAAESRADALAQEVERKDAALGLYANEVNWKLGGPCDPNSPNFAGISFARAALANEEAGQ